jgi:hypothetical protein
VSDLQTNEPAAYREICLSMERWYEEGEQYSERDKNVRAGGVEGADSEGDNVGGHVLEGGLGWCWCNVVVVD